MGKVADFLKHPLVAGVISILIATPITTIITTRLLYTTAYVKGVEEGRKRGYDAGYKEGVDAGLKDGYEKGMKEGQRYSIIKFLEEQQYRLGKLEEFSVRFFEVRTEENRINLLSSARAIVEAVQIWREIDRQFQEVLNGQVNELDIAVRKEDYNKISEISKILKETHNVKLLAAHTKIMRLIK